MNLTRPERLALVEHGHPGVSLTLQADLLGVSRSSLYYQPVLPSAEEVALKHRIDEIYTASPFYGSRRITVVLNREMTINRKKVQRYMREMGIAGICPGPNLSQRHADHPIYPYLLRNVTVSYPNHVWGIDITYIRLVGRVDVPGGGPGLVLALCGQLGTGPDPGNAFRPERGRTGSGSGHPHDLEQ